MHSFEDIDVHVKEPTMGGEILCCLSNGSCAKTVTWDSIFYCPRY